MHNDEKLRPTRTRRPKLAEEIIEALRQDILSGLLPAGGRLPSEREIALRFGASQPTVREALRALDSAGMLEVKHGSGTYVRPDASYSSALALQNLVQLTRIGILEVLDVREALGLESARRAARVADAADHARLRERLLSLEKIGESKAVDDILDRIIGFQEAISLAAKNPLLQAIESFFIRLLLQLQLGPVGARGVANWQARSLGFQEDRARIVRAIVAGDPTAAGTAMENYLAHQRKTFRDDAELGRMRVTDPQALSTLANIVGDMRASQPNP